MICSICNKEVVYLGNHLRYNHSDMSLKNYYDNFLKKDKEGVCKREGCGNATNFLNVRLGYSECCSVRCAAVFNKDKIQKTNMERYGCKVALQNKHIKHKAEQTKLLRYGDINYNNSEKIAESLLSRDDESVKEWANKVRSQWNNKTQEEKNLINSKRNETFFKKYSISLVDNLKNKLKQYLNDNGVINSSQVKEVSESIQKSLQKTWESNKEDILLKIRNTTMERYGYYHIMHDENMKKSILEKVKIANIKNGNWLPSELISPFQKYKNRVYGLTKKNSKLKFSVEELEKVGKCGVRGAMQIDHMFSIKEGFINGVPPEIIASPYNLRLVSWEENDTKKDECCISLEKLIENYK